MMETISTFAWGMIAGQASILAIERLIDLIYLKRYKSNINENEDDTQIW